VERRVGEDKEEGEERRDENTQRAKVIKRNGIVEEREKGVMQKKMSGCDSSFYV